MASPGSDAVDSESDHYLLVQSAKSVTLFHMTDVAETAQRADDLPLGPDSLVWKYWEAVLETGEKESHCE